MSTLNDTTLFGHYTPPEPQASWRGHDLTTFDGVLAALRGALNGAWSRKTEDDTALFRIKERCLEVGWTQERIAEIETKAVIECRAYRSPLVNKLPRGHGHRNVSPFKGDLTEPKTGTVLEMKLNEAMRAALTGKIKR